MNCDLKSNFLKYYNKCIKSFAELKKERFYIRLGRESRELLGVINFLWFYDYISDDERDNFFNETYDYISEADLNLRDF